MKFQSICEYHLTSPLTAVSLASTRLTGSHFGWP